MADTYSGYEPLKVCLSFPTSESMLSADDGSVNDAYEPVRSSSPHRNHPPVVPGMRSADKQRRCEARLLTDLAEKLSGAFREFLYIAAQAGKYVFR